MTEKNEARVRTRAPMVPIGAKTLLSLLMAVVMLVGLLPVTALAAAGESHPIKVGRLKDGLEMRVSYRYNDLTYSAYFSDEKDGIAGSTPDEKWASLKKINSYLPDGHSERREVVGWSYYDPDSGRFYHKGTVKARTDFVYQASTTEDTLTFIVDSNLTAANGLYSKSEDTGLKNLNIELRNGATLTINGGVWKSRGDYQTAAALDITRTEEMGTWDDYNRTVYQYGDLTLKGNGTLKVNVPDEECVLYGICANNISIKDNVSLDIKTIGNTFKYSSSGDGVMSAAIFCYGYLNIDTTGTVNIVCQKAPSKPNVNNPNSYNALDWVGERIYLTNAQSVTLNVVKKEDTFVTGGRYRPEHYNAFVNKATANDWTVTETEDTAKPSYTVTMTPKAMPTAAELTVGDNPSVKNIGSAISSVTVNGGETVAVKASVTLPTWLSNMYAADRVKLGDSGTLSIYKGSSLSASDRLTDITVTNGISDSVVSYSTSFTPDAGKTYTVYACIPIVTKDGGKQLGSASVIATIKAVEKQDTVIPAVKLEMGNPLVNGSTTHPSVTAVSPENYMSGGTIWQQGGTDAGSFTGGETYTLTKYLTANDGYKFTNATVVSLDGPGTVTKKEVTGGGKKLTVTVSSTAMFTVDFRDSNGNTATAQQCFNKDEKLVLPDQSSEAPEGKIFAGWKSGDTTYQPGDEITVTSNLTFTETWKEPESYGLRVAPFSRTFMVREKEGYSNTNPQKYSFALSSTGSSDLGKITVSVDTTRTPRWGEYKEYLYLNGVQQDSVTLNSVDDGFFVVLQKPAESYGEPKDFINATVWLKIASENGDIEKTAQVRIIADPGPYVVSCTLVQPDTADGATSPYKLIEGSDAYSVTFVPDGIDPNDVPAGTEVGLVAPEIPGYKFKQWVDFSATAGAGVQFTDEHSTATSFVMPKRDIGRYSAGIFAVYEPIVAPTHTHNYGTTYTKLDDTRHYQTCTSATGTCNEPMKVEEHTFSGAWTAVANTDTHKRTCTASGCAAEQAEKHNWVIVSQTDATLDHTGEINYRCSDCNATKQETVAKLEKIVEAKVTVTAPVRGAAPEWADTTDSTYYVADTAWEPAITDKFASGTKYTVKVTLEAYNGYAFKGDGILGIGDTTFTINGNKAKVVSSGAQQVVITYEFPATAANYYYAGSGGTTTAKPEKSPGTGDPGVMLYAAMGLLSLSGGAWVVGKKRKDK